MRIQLSVSENRYEELKKQLTALGIEIDDDADLILSEKNTFASFLTVKNQKDERVKIFAQEIIFIESYGHNLEVHTADEIYKSAERLYQLVSMLDPQKFLRVSNSVIISKDHVKKVKPSLSMKFVLTMSDGTLVDVTRSYYSSFKTFFGF